MASDLNSAAQVLEACPFCERPPIPAVQETPGPFNKRGVWCVHCNAWGPERPTEAEAIAAWNRRVPVSTPASTGEGEFAKAVLDGWLEESHIDHHEGPWYQQSLQRMTAAIRAALPPSSGWAQNGSLVAWPLDQWHEDMGAVMWWKFPVVEAPWVGSPGDSDWPGYHTHWTPLPPPPSREGVE